MLMSLQELQTRLETLERENTELRQGSDMITQEAHSQLLQEMTANHETEKSEAVAKVRGSSDGSVRVLQH